MKKRTKIWLAAGALLAFLGCILFVGGMTMLKWDFAGLSTAKYETNRYEIGEDFENISVLTKTADVVFVPAAEGDAVTVECYEQKNVTHTVAVKDGVLTIEVEDTRKWYEHIGIHFRTPKITVRIPTGEYGALSVRSNTGDTDIPSDFRFREIDVTASTGDVDCAASVQESIRIKLTTGDIELGNITAGSLDLSVTTGEIEASCVTCIGEMRVKVSTGDAHLTDVACGKLYSEGSTGDISLKNLIAEEIVIERSTGDVKFALCDAPSIDIKTDTGNVNGTLLTGKIFDAKSSTGRVRVPDPDATTGGRCKVRCDTGSIKITVA